MFQLHGFEGFDKDFTWFYMLQNEKTVPFSGHGKARSICYIFAQGKGGFWGTFAWAEGHGARARRPADLEPVGSRRGGVGRTPGGAAAPGSARVEFGQEKIPGGLGRICGVCEVFMRCS